MGTLRDRLKHAIATCGIIRAVMVLTVLVFVTTVIIMPAGSLSVSGGVHRRSMFMRVMLCCGEVFEEMVYPMRRGGGQKKEKETNYAHSHRRMWYQDSRVHVPEQGLSAMIR